MQDQTTQFSLLRTLDPLFGYGWDVYPKSTLLVLVDALAQGYVEQWEDILDQLVPQENRRVPVGVVGLYGRNAVGNST